jgi:transcriptional regulator with XRE-family HTH domain
VNTVDKNIREAMQKAMSAQGLSNAELARRLEVTPQAVGQIVNGKRGSIPESLLNVLGELGLELKVVPKS